jgi:DNA replication protein DnaC
VSDISPRPGAPPGFPFLKTVHEFDFGLQPSLQATMLAPHLSRGFAAEGRSLVFWGKPGRGKTHLAIAVAQRAIENGFDALFVTAGGLVDTVSRHARHGRAGSAMQKYLRPGVLVVDDIGHLRHNPDAASILFQVVSERHRRGRSLIATSHKAPWDWAEPLGDQDVAEAIADRMLERGTHFELGGPSMRVASCDRAHVPAPTSCPRVAEPSTVAPEDGESLCKNVARALVGRLGLKDALYHLRGAMSAEALVRTAGSRRAAAQMLGVDRRYVQRLVDEYASTHPIGDADVDDDV